MMNLAILGAGGIARKMAETVKGMLESGSRDATLYAVAARDEDRARDFAAHYGIPHAYGSYEDMLRDPDVDLVYVATPHSHHAAHMKLCIEHGKAVLCEKAFTATAAQAEEVLALAASRGVMVTEAIWTRYMPSRRLIESLLHEGVIGTPRVLTANLGYAIEQVPRIRQPELAGGALLDLGVYVLNFAGMFFGADVTRMESSVEMMDTGVDRQETITLHYGDGRMASLIATSACNTDRQCTICGDKGYLTVDNVNNPQEIRLYDLSRSGTPVRVIPVPRQVSGYEYEVEACARALREGALECPDMPHAETLRIMRQMDALRAQWGMKYPFE